MRGRFGRCSVDDRLSPFRRAVLTEAPKLRYNVALSPDKGATSLSPTTKTSRGSWLRWRRTEAQAINASASRAI
jgi:hypothetical protein